MRTHSCFVCWKRKSITSKSTPPTNSFTVAIGRLAYIYHTHTSLEIKNQLIMGLKNQADISNYLCHNRILLRLSKLPFGPWHRTSGFIIGTWRFNCAIQVTYGAVNDALPARVVLGEIRQQYRHRSRYDHDAEQYLEHNLISTEFTDQR